MQLERFKNLSPIYLDEQKLFSFNFEINYNNNLLKDYYIKFKHQTNIKEKSIEIYTLRNNFYNNENKFRNNKD